MARTPPRPNAQSIELRIESLELVGFDPARRFAIADAVHAELRHLLQSGSLPMSPLDQASHTIHAEGLRADAPPRVVGRVVARAIFAALPRS